MLPPPPVSYDEEEDTEHALDVPLAHVPGGPDVIHPDVLERMAAPTTALNRNDLDTATSELEAVLELFRVNKLPPSSHCEMTLESSPILLLAQSRFFRICRADVFCPLEGCPRAKEIHSIGKLANHLCCDHGASADETTDMVQYFIICMIPHNVE
jgi:hypothetical protein